MVISFSILAWEFIKNLYHVVSQWIKNYLEILDRLSRRVMRVRMEIADDWILRASSRQGALAHSSVSPWICGIPVLPQAPYFQICYLVIFTCSKNYNRVKGYHFQIFDGVQTAVTDAIKTLTEVDFQPWCETWKIRWAKCVASERCYYEGHNVDLGE
jgi:hypothetical protein